MGIFSDNMEQIILTTLLKNKKSAFAVSSCLLIIGLIILLTMALLTPVECIYVEPCDHFTVKLNSMYETKFCLNETNSDLLNIKILEKDQCTNIYKFSKQQTILFLNALNECFYNPTFLCNTTRFHTDVNGGNNCIYFQETSCIKFCFDHSYRFVGIILNKYLFLYPMDAHHLHIYLRALLGKQ